MKGKVFVFVTVLVVLLAVTEGLRKRRPKNLKITDCMKNASDAAVTLKSYYLIPDPMELPGNMTLGGHIQVHRFLDGNLTGHVQISKWFGFFWLPVPCISNVGTCTYHDLCGMIDRVISGNGTDVTNATMEEGTHGVTGDVSPSKVDGENGTDVTATATKAATHGVNGEVRPSKVDGENGTDVTTTTTKPGTHGVTGDVGPGKVAGENETCPKALQYSTLPACSCPFPPGNYLIRKANLEVHHLSGLISWLATGDYKAKVWMTDEEDETIACLQLELSVVEGKKEPNTCTGFLCGLFG